MTRKSSKPIKIYTCDYCKNASFVYCLDCEDYQCEKCNKDNHENIKHFTISVFDEFRYS